MSDHRKRILDLLASGKINVDEADLLLERIAQKMAKPEPEMPAQPKETPPPGPPGPRYIRVVVSDKDGEKANVRLPIGLVKAGIKLQAIVPEVARVKLKEKGVDLDVIGAMKPEDMVQAIADLTVDADNRNGEKVRVYCE